MEPDESTNAPTPAAPTWYMSSWAAISFTVAVIVGTVVGGALAAGVGDLEPGVSVAKPAAWLGFAAAASLFSVLQAIGYVRDKQERAADGR